MQRCCLPAAAALQASISGKQHNQHQHTAAAAQQANSAQPPHDCPACWGSLIIKWCGLGKQELACYAVLPVQPHLRLPDEQQSLRQQQPFHQKSSFRAATAFPNTLKPTQALPAQQHESPTSALAADSKLIMLGLSTAQYRLISPVDVVVAVQQHLRLHNGHQAGGLGDCCIAGQAICAVCQSDAAGACRVKAALKCRHQACCCCTAQQAVLKTPKPEKHDASMHWACRFPCHCLETIGSQPRPANCKCTLHVSVQPAAHLKGWR